MSDSDKNEEASDQGADSEPELDEEALLVHRTQFLEQANKKRESSRKSSQSASSS